jgi:hypothetical protein
LSASTTDAGTLTAGTSTLGATTLTGGLSGSTANLSGAATASSFVKTGGTSAQFLKANGDVDANTYITEEVLSANIVKSIKGTNNQVNATANAGVITLSFPESVTIANTVNANKLSASTTDAGTLTAGTSTLGATTLTGSLSGSTANLSGAATASSFVKAGGTSAQFLKADGSVDAAAYLTEEVLSANIVKSIKGTNNQVNATANAGVITLSFPESVTISNTVNASKLSASTTDAGTLTAGTSTLGATTLTGGLSGSTVNLSGAATASSFVKTGGTSAQFLKADGSVDAAAYLTELNLSESFVKSINGTASQINAQANAGKITLSLPDAVAIKTSVTVPNVNATTTNAGTLTAGATTLGVTTASSFVKTGGTTSQFLKADGSVDESTYLTSATLSSTLSNTFASSSNFESGSFTATLTKGTNVTNANDVSFTQATYTRMGNIVTVSIGFVIKPGNAGDGLTNFTMSLPISTISSKKSQLNVGGISVYGANGGVVSITDTNIATATFKASGQSQVNGNATFSYVIR